MVGLSRANIIQYVMTSLEIKAGPLLNQTKFQGLRKVSVFTETVSQFWSKKGFLIYTTT